MHLYQNGHANSLVSLNLLTDFEKERGLKVISRKDQNQGLISFVSIRCT